MTPTRSLVFREMDHAECHALLERNHVGRIAYSFHDRVDIEPIHYVYADGYIYGRMGVGTKLEILAHHPWVAFEVDEVSDLFHWRSVVVRGTVYRIEPGDDVAVSRAYDHAVQVLRRLVPAAFTPRDPTPERAVIFRIFVDDVTGRTTFPD
jgi:hypothetical protein